MSDAKLESCTKRGLEKDQVVLPRVPVIVGSAKILGAISCSMLKLQPCSVHIFGVVCQPVRICPVLDSQLNISGDLKGTADTDIAIVRVRNQSCLVELVGLLNDGLVPFLQIVVFRNLRLKAGPLIT